MAVIEGVCRQVLEATEFVTIVTQGKDGPHVVATWGDYIRQLGIGSDTLMVPAGHYLQTEANLQRDSRVQVLAASRQVRGSHGLGQGVLVTGNAEVRVEGAEAAAVKEQFPWARGVLVIRAESAVAQL